MTDTESIPAVDQAEPAASEQPAAVVARAGALTWAADRAPVTGPRPTAVDSDDLLAGLPRRPLLRSSVVTPVLSVIAVVALYAAVTLWWPLTAVSPQAVPAELTPLTASAAAPAWPENGSAAVAVAGFESTGEAGTVASTADAGTIASITKLVTALMVLERAPLAVGETGPEYAFTSADRSAYQSTRSRGESATPVPVGKTLTEYQMLQAMLIASANNYAQRLADEFWPSDAAFANAARDWLSAHGVNGVTIVEPTGIDPGNTATPAGVVSLGRKALEHPVVAQIVATREAELPGVGKLTNTNELLADPGVVGIKTGTLITKAGEANDLAAAKDLTIAGQTVRVFAAVLGQPSDEQRWDATRALFAQLEAELATPYVIPAGSSVGTVETAWGESGAILTSTDASVVLWNGASATSSPAFSVAPEWTAGSSTGTLTLSGPIGSSTVETTLSTTLTGPSAWWRLTHPLQLFGLLD